LDTTFQVSIQEGWSREKIQKRREKKQQKPINFSFVMQPIACYSPVKCSWAPPPEVIPIFMRRVGRSTLCWLPFALTVELPFQVSTYLGVLQASPGPSTTVNSFADYSALHIRFYKEIA
jgi:hypothetical protein